MSSHRKEKSFENHNENEDFDTSHNWYTFDYDVKTENKIKEYNTENYIAEDEGTSNQQQEYQYGENWGIEEEEDGEYNELMGGNDGAAAGPSSGGGHLQYHETSYGQEDSSDWGWHQDAATADGPESSQTGFWTSGVSTHVGDDGHHQQQQQQQIIMRPSDADIVKQHNIIMYVIN